MKSLQSSVYARGTYRWRQRRVKGFAVNNDRLGILILLLVNILYS